jgi:hypothetical protein
VPLVLRFARFCTTQWPFYFSQDAMSTEGNYHVPARKSRRVAIGVIKRAVDFSPRFAYQIRAQRSSRPWQGGFFKFSMPGSVLISVTMLGTRACCGSKCRDGYLASVEGFGELSAGGCCGMA